MISAFLVAAAAYLFFGQSAVEKARAIADRLAPHVTRQHAIAAVLIAAAVVLHFATSVDRQPTPAPLPPDAFTLRGLFQGPSASDDATKLSALLAEMADCVERDGMLSEPRLKTGAAIDDLRIAARDARMKGDSIGARQPKVRQAVHEFLDAAVGTSGGPISPSSRAAWVAAFRDLSRAAAEAVQ
jgi:hypothetical protein